VRPGDPDAVVVRDGGAGLAHAGVGDGGVRGASGGERTKRDETFRERYGTACVGWVREYRQYCESRDSGARSVRPRARSSRRRRWRGSSVS
jgi:hypothetical protein